MSTGLQPQQETAPNYVTKELRIVSAEPNKFFYRFSKYRLENEDLVCMSSSDSISVYHHASAGTCFRISRYPRGEYAILVHGPEKGIKDTMTTLELITEFELEERK